MAMTLVAMLGLVLLLSYANGSNDISKGIATLVGSGVSSFKTAVVWGTVWTVCGGLLAAAASQGLAATFAGRGFLARPMEGPAFLSAVAVGAIVWVLFASRTGLPVSTTHAIAGALAGAGLVAQGTSALHWSFLARKVALPLALSPVLSLALVYAVFPLLQRAVSRVETYCLCVERRTLVAESGAFSVTVGSSTVVGSVEECAGSPAVAARISAVDALHWVSSALTSFARGLNDTPKIVALGVVAAAGLGISGFRFYVAVAAVMAAGSLIAGLRVTETLARKVTPMAPGEGFAANLVTTLLVGAASLAALPVSTTHVSSGAIVGIGLHRGSNALHWSTVRNILLAWFVTLPAAALAAAGAYALFHVVV